MTREQLQSTTTSNWHLVHGPVAGMGLVESFRKISMKPQFTTVTTNSQASSVTLVLMVGQPSRQEGNLLGLRPGMEGCMGRLLQLQMELYT